MPSETDEPTDPEYPGDGSEPKSLEDADESDGRIGRYTPSEQSLDFSERVAQVQGVPFDREATRALGTNLYEEMYAELVQVLELEGAVPDFHSGVFRSPRAFSAYTPSGRPIVGLDMIFEYWMTSLHHIVGVLAFTVPDKTEERRIARDVTSLFGLFQNSGDFKRVRGPIAYYYLAQHYAEIIRISNLLSRASLVFVMCHELAHLQLNHHGRAAGPDQELEADRRAAELFKHVVAKGQENRLGIIHIDPKVMCGPLIFTMILELFEAWLISRGVDLSGGTHPPASERTAQLQPLLQDEFNDVAADIIQGSTHAIFGLHDLLKLPRPAA